MHDDRGARIGHAFEETAAGEADNANARAGREGEQIAAGFARDVRRTAEPGGDVSANEGEDGCGDTEEGEHPDALLEIAADLRTIVAAVCLRNGGGHRQRAPRHEEINEGEDLRGERHRGEGEVAVAPGHDRINHRLTKAQKLHENKGNGEA